MDRGHAQLLGDQLPNESQGLLGRTGVPAGGRPDLVAVGAADGVAVVAVGDQHVRARHGGADGLDPGRVGDPLDHVLHAVVHDAAQHLARLGEQGGQPGGQGQSPHRGEVGPRRARQVESVGRRLGRGPLVRQHPAGTLVHDLQPTEHTDEVPLRSGGIGEPQAVEGEGGLGVTHQHPGVLPVAQALRRAAVAVLPAQGDVDVDDVVLRARRQGADLGLAQDVVGRGGDDGEVVSGVAEGTEGAESRHDDHGGTRDHGGPAVGCAPARNAHVMHR